MEDNINLFTKKFRYIALGFQGKLGQDGNICINKVINDYYEIERQQLKEQKVETLGRKR